MNNTKKDMFTHKGLISLLCGLFLLGVFHAEASVERINRDWKFRLGDYPTAKEATYDDASWSTVHLPHDWAFEGGYSQNGAQKDKGGYASGGIGWYRKTLHVTKEMLADKYLFIDFDAVYMNSEVWVNGQYLGKRPYGYVSFSYDLTQYLHEGTNTLAVRVDNSLEPSARWYHGCGIYGNVHMRSQAATYFEKDGTFIRTPKITDKQGIVLVNTEVTMRQNGGKYTVNMMVLDDSQHTVSTLPSQSVQLSKGLNKLSAEGVVLNPVLWSLDNPALYYLHMTIKNNQGEVVDTQNIHFGFRTLDWKPETGFYLNGKQTKLRGVCEHLEGGPTGAIYTEKLLRWKIQLIKDMGCNAIRVAHNPQIPAFYDLCDEMGVLVMDEFFDGWHKKADYDYGMQAFDEWWERDLRATVRRNRNHPSIFLYSVGNETRGEVGAELVRVCHEEDPTRLVTSGDSYPEAMDVHGVNGHSEKKHFLDTYQPDGRAFIGTENPHTWQVRGYYRTQTWYRNGYPNTKQDPQLIPNLNDKEIFGYDWTSPAKRRNSKQIFNSSYDNATVRVTARHLIEILRDRDWFSGSFRWTGFDYLGEAGYVHGGWPFRAFQSGALDLAGFPKDLYYLYQSEWSNQDMVHILPHWTHPKMELGTEIPVWVYTTGDEVELFLNGQSLGKKKKGLSWDKMQCEWLVPWQPGTIEAIAYRNGRMIARTTQQTAGAPAQLAVSVEGESLQADGEDISIVSIEQQDAKGVMYPYGENRVYTALTGGARVLSFESGSPVDVECNFEADSKACFFGLNRLFIQSTDMDAKQPVRLLLGAIQGDKKLMLSDKVTIGVQEIALRGKKSGRNYKIAYTTNGEAPTVHSKPYTGAFSIKLGTTVKAIVYDGSKVLLRMEERFTEEDGLYWGTPGEAACEFSGEQAEQAQLKDAFFKKKGGDGFYATGYVVPKGNKGSVTWYQENDGGKMDCTISIRYSQQADTPTTKMELWNNDQLIKTIEFKNTGSKASHWRELFTGITIYSGGNNIMLKSVTDNAPALDQIMIIQ